MRGMDVTLGCQLTRQFCSGTLVLTAEWGGGGGANVIHTVQKLIRWEGESVSAWFSVKNKSVSAELFQHGEQIS